MEFGLVTISLLVVSALLVLGGLKLLISNGWFLHFLRGFAGFTSLLLALLIVMSGLNIASYSELTEGQQLANVSFTQIAPQNFEVTVTNLQNGMEQKVTIDGDLWQAETRVLELAFAPASFFHIDQINGKFYSLDQEQTNLRNTYPVAGETAGLDLWSLFSERSIGILWTRKEKSSFQPMADGAVFSVSVGKKKGLVSRPVNEAANAIVNEWN